MTISFPLSLPSPGPREVRWGTRSQVGMSVSPFTFSQQTYVHQGDMWLCDVSLPPMVRADAEEWLAFFLSLNGREGYFLMGDPIFTTARGTWSGDSPQVSGAHSAGTKVLAVKNLSNAATVKKGDWLQLGSAATSRLHKSMTDQTANAAGFVTLDVWPRLRQSAASNDAITISSPKGMFRLASNDQDWSDVLGQHIEGISFSAIEYLTT